MTDLVNVHLTKGANEVLEQIMSTGCFDYAITAAKFAMAYALKNHFDEINPATYTLTDSGGSNYGVGTVDPDGQLAALIRALYPETTTPYLYARALMVYGLMKLGERIDGEGMQTISALM